MEQEAQSPNLDVESAVKDILGTIDREREREIISRRFGLFDRRETLEQIGELLGITRERVRQLEKSVVSRFKSQAGQGQLPHVKQIEASLIQQLQHTGDAARVSDLSSAMTAENSKTDQSRLVFLAMLCPRLCVLEEDDRYYQTVGIAGVRDLDAMKADISKLIDAISKAGEPITIQAAAKAAQIDNVAQAAALA